MQTKKQKDNISKVNNSLKKKKLQSKIETEEESNLEQNSSEMQDEIVQIQDAEDGEGIEKLATMMKTSSDSKLKQKERLRKIMDFRFRTLELVQIFLRRTKNPTIFLKYVSPLVVSLRENQKDKAKDVLVNKISVLLKLYMDRQQSFGLNYSSELEECVTEILFNARKVTSKKIHKVLKYLLKCFLAIVFKADLKSPIEGLIEKYQEALEAYISKKNVELDGGYFKELVRKYKTIGVELTEILIKGANLKNFGGAKSEVRREECLSLLTALVQSSAGNSDYLIAKVIQNQKEVGDLIVNTLENIDQVKNKQFSALQKYYNLFKLILKLLIQVKAQENGDDVLKQKAGSLIDPLKKRVSKRLNDLKDKEFIKSNKNYYSKVDSMISEISVIDQ